MFPEILKKCPKYPQKISKYPEKLSKYLAKIVINPHYFDSKGEDVLLIVVVFQFHGICHRSQRV